MSGIFSSGLDKYATDDTKTSIPPNLRSMIARACTTDLSQASKAPVDDQRIHCPSYTHDDSGTGLTTIKQREHGTIRSPIATATASSDLPPHLRGKIQEVPGCPDDRGIKNVPSESDIIPNLPGSLEHANAASVAGTYTSAIPASDMSAGRSMNDVDSDSEFDATEPLHARDGSRANKGNMSLLPHLRGKLDQPISIHEKVVESENSPVPSVSAGQSTVEPDDSGNQSTSDQPSHLRDNFGVAPTIKSYATVAKSSENIPPHLRQRQGGHSAPTTGQETAVTSPQHVDQISWEGRSSSLGLPDASPDAIEPGTRVTVRMRDEDEDTGLGCHDPEHPRYNPEFYFCRFTTKYQCPIGTCA